MSKKQEVIFLEMLIQELQAGMLNDEEGAKGGSIKRALGLANQRMTGITSTKWHKKRKRYKRREVKMIPYKKESEL